MYILLKSYLRRSVKLTSEKQAFEAKVAQRLSATFAVISLPLEKMGCGYWMPFSMHFPVRLSVQPF